MACAATGMTAAVDLLQPLLADRVDFVRQGAMIAMALVLVQQPEARVAPFRKQLAKAMGDKHEEVMCRCVIPSSAICPRAMSLLGRCTRDV